MTLSRKIIAGAIATLAIATHPAIAQTSANDSNSSSDENKSPTLELTKIPTAIRINVVNGIIKYLNNSKQVTLGLEWSLLPDSPNLDRESIGTIPLTCHIKNNNLGNPDKWIEDLSDKCKEGLKDALMVSDLKEVNPQQTIKTSNDFKKFWLEPSNSGDNPSDNSGDNPDKNRDNGYDSVFNGSISASDYFSLQRDHLQILNLLKSNGIGYMLEVTGADATNLPEQKRRSDGSDITWEIKIFEFTASRKPEIKRYRFTAKAMVEPFNLVFPNKTSENEGDLGSQANLDVTFEFIPGEGTIGLFQTKLMGSQTTIELRPATEEKLNELENQIAEGQLSTVLSLLGSSNLGEFVTNGILAGTQNASIISGGMIADDNVEPIIGANLELFNMGNEATGGIALGIGYTDNNPLYVGLSLQYSGIVIKFNRGKLINLVILPNLQTRAQNTNNWIIN